MEHKDRQQTEVRENGIRLNKYFSESGVCSRREADRRILAGRVLVDGVRATEGQRLYPGQVVTCDGKVISGKDRPVLLMINKPRGIVCTTSNRDRAENIVGFIHYPYRIYPVGRLDKESEGLLFMTNEGELVNKILRARYGHEKEYIVTVDRPVTLEFIEKMSRGVKILDTVTRPCPVEQLGERQFRIILTQGLNRQIRRMCESLHFNVVRLKRVRIMNISMGNLKTGQYREVTPEERAELERLLDENANRFGREEETRPENTDEIHMGSADSH